MVVTKKARARKKVLVVKVAVAATKKVRARKTVKALAVKVAVAATRTAKVLVAKRKTLKAPAAKVLAAALSKLAVTSNSLEKARALRGLFFGRLFG